MPNIDPTTGKRVYTKRRTKSAATKVRVAKAKPTAQETATKAVSTALAAVARVVGVRFPDNTTVYSYYTRDESLVEGDYAIVISPYANRQGGSFPITSMNGYLNIVQIAEVKETVQAINVASKWIIDRIDVTAAIKEAERQEQIAILKAKISKARKEAEERVKLEQLRELSPELDTLMNQYDQLVG